jgi:signal transduction histidine kinase
VSPAAPWEVAVPTPRMPSLRRLLRLPPSDAAGSRPQGLPGRAARWLGDVSLERRFLAFSLLVLLAGALLIGFWVSRAISEGVLARSAATSALYAESFLGPLIHDVSFDEPLPAERIAQLDALFVSTRFAEQVVSVKLWAPDGTLRYALAPELIGRRFTGKSSLTRAVDGQITSHVSSLQRPEHAYEAPRWSQLIETYVPIWSPDTGSVVAVAEFYELPDALLAQLRAARLTGWLIVGSATFAMFVLLNGMMRGASRTIRGQNATLNQLMALHGATLTLSGETRAEAALQQAVELSARLAGARYGALAVTDDAGRVVQFLTTGVDEDARARIGRFPEGRGLLGELSRPDARLRLSDVRAHPAGAGFPAGHPEMTQLLGVPLVHQQRVLGALYLGDRLDGEPFSAVDEEIAGMFATHAAVVLENARLYDDLQALAVERERQHIAREMHDGLAQVLGFVNTKAQAAEQFLRSGDAATARQHLAELSEAARRVYADIREGIVALRVQSGGDRSLRQVLEAYVEEFRQFSRIEVEVSWQLDEDEPRVSQLAEVQMMRIIQEALTNVRRHASAQSAIVTLRESHGALEVVVRDDGRGFDPAQVSRGQWPQFGLRAMRERAESVGGTLEVQSAPGEGTTVRARLPAAPVRTAAVRS